MAVALEGGLITPIVRGTDKKSVGQIAREVRELAERARNRQLRPEEYMGATFSISNLGMFGIDEFTAIINPPEAAIWPSVRRRRWRLCVTERSWSSKSCASLCLAIIALLTGRRAQSFCKHSRNC